MSDVPDMPEPDAAATIDPSPPNTTMPANAATPVDLDAIERDLTAVEVALGRLADGTYWTDEVTGEPIPDGAIAANPIARRA